MAIRSWTALCFRPFLWNTQYLSHKTQKHNTCSLQIGTLSNKLVVWHRLQLVNYNMGNVCRTNIVSRVILSQTINGLYSADMTHRQHCIWVTYSHVVMTFTDTNDCVHAHIVSHIYSYHNIKGILHMVEALTTTMEQLLWSVWWQRRLTWLDVTEYLISFKESPSSCIGCWPWSIQTLIA